MPSNVNIGKNVKIERKMSGGINVYRILSTLIIDTTVLKQFEMPKISTLTYTYFTGKLKLIKAYDSVNIYYIWYI